MIATALAAPPSAFLLPLLPMLLVGLAGSVHCVGMCGGIVSAFSMLPGRAFPVAVVRQAAPQRVLVRVAAYNAGRIASYCAAGALAGAIGGQVGGGARQLAGVASLAAIAMPGLWLVSAMLVALGLYLSGAWRGLAVLERLGGHLWRRIEPFTAMLLPLDRPHKLFAMGALWGWLPCGMVYSSLLAALVCGSAAQGALLMLAFGLGTLPLLIAVGVAGGQLRALLQRRPARFACGALVAGFGVAGMLRAAGGFEHLLPGLCLAPGLGT
ncbi:MAG: cytochrome biosis protein [Massilia sp.]|nr:cytochrome biosis protein [Massilia sp.]